MSSDLEKRLADALEARASQVGPEHLSPRGLPAPERRGPARPVWVGLAAAACLAAVGAGVVVPRLLADPDSAAPPAVSRPDVPSDVGRDWTPIDGVRSELDLDGDGESDAVELRGEPDPGYEGRTRLDVDLSGGGTAYGVVDLGSTLTSYSPQGADLDGDGTDEMVLTLDVAETSTRPLVLDLRDGVLVEVEQPLGDRTPLTAGPLQAGVDPDSGLVEQRVTDWWVADGTLRSSVSETAYPALGMSWFVPDPYVAQVVTWRLDGDVLLSRPADDVCVSRLDDERRPCGPGEQDGLPDLTPAAGDLVATGQTADLEGGLPSRVRVVDAGGRDRVLLGAPGEPGSGFERTGTRLRIFTTAPSAVVVDAVTAAYDSDADDRPDGVLVESEVGGISVLAAPDDDPAWLTAGGEVYTTSAASGRVGLGQWVRDGDELVVVPLGTVCLPDDGDVTAAERC
ncbi:hypothetical protein [Nocardioides sp. CFH 31398]|uniref:hypothetical protein n=1 Tax=Nocardioides sp. CFH 31398 TaxID=2919579 RepID=UPI001F05EAE9|nr:hypothetical protein [Nocardioides sp. CFH 31398]MCH1866608.1 hypothetical protein [Nocardioides sp. CFH 31398]